MKAALVVVRSGILYVVFSVIPTIVPLAASDLIAKP